MNNVKKRKVNVYDVIDRTKIGALALIFMFVVVTCAFLYMGLSPSGNGITSTYTANNCNCDENITFWDGLYFSSITVSSLGYGDFRPVGVGRFISGFEVIFGLALFSLLIAKLASERQSILIRLMYSSDTERRIKQFSLDLNSYTTEIHKWKTNYTKSDHSVSTLKSMRKFIGGLSSYLNYQANEGMLLDIGADSYLRKLFKEISKLEETMLVIARGSVTNTDVRDAIEINCNVLYGIAQSFSVWGRDDQIKGLCGQIIKMLDDYKRGKERNRLWRNKVQYELNEELLVTAKQYIPDKPWPKHPHKELAKQLNISNSLAEKIIAELISRNDI